MNMVKRWWHMVNWPLVVVTVLAVAAAYPLLSQPGLLNTRGGGDSPFLLQRLHQLETALRDGHFPVRWMPDANYGYGYPFFNYYAPLSIYIAAAFRLFGFSYVQAIHLAQLSGFLVAGWGMYALARRWWGGEWAGVLSAAAYTFAPFHMVNIYVRGDSLAEFWAMAFYPWVFLAAGRAVNSEQLAVSSNQSSVSSLQSLSLSISQSLPFALLYAALILSHNISALIFTPFLLLYILVRIAANQPTHHAPRILFALFLAFALSAWFWWPALGEQHLAQLGPVTEGYFHYSNHFRGRDLIQSSLLFNYDITAGSNPFRMGLIQSFVTGLGLMAMITIPVMNGWAKKRNNDTHHASPNHVSRTPPLISLLIPLIFLFIATFMITPASRWLWDHVPLLPFTQFPWRFLSVQAFAAAFVVGILGKNIVSSGQPSVTSDQSVHNVQLSLLPSRITHHASRFIILALCLLLTYSALADLHPDHLLLNDADVTAERLAEYEWFTGNIGSTVSAEYLPEWVRPRPYSSDWLVNGERDRAISWPDTAVTIRERSTDQQIWHITVPPGEAAHVMLPTLYWPGWQAELGDGTPVALQPADGSGLIQFTLPGGDHELTLRLTRTPLRLAAELVSFAAALLVLFIFSTRIYTDLHGFKAALTYHAPRITLTIVLFGFIALLLPSPAAQGNQTWDFAQMGYLHPAEVIPFENGATLEQYEYETGAAVAAATWTVTLWLNGSDGATEGTLALTTPAVNRFAAAPPLALITQPLHNGANTFTFIFPENAPPGLYVPRFTMANDAAALTPSGQSRGDLFLRPFRLTNPTNPPAPEVGLNVKVDGVGCLNSEQSTVNSECTTNCSLSTVHCSLSVQMAWYTATPLSHNLSVSLLLTRPNGEWLSQFDTQPGYGFLPSVSWPAATWVNDWLSIPLPDETPPYYLVVRLYEQAGTVRLTRRLGVVTSGASGFVFEPTQPSFALPEGIEPMDVWLGDAAALRGYTVEQTTPTLNVTLYWEALTPGNTDYRHFIHLIDPATGEIVAQHDAMPVNNSYPTSQWTKGEIVRDAAAINLENIPPGTYQLITGLYTQTETGDFLRLPAQTGNGSLYPDNAIPLNLVIIS